MLKLRSLLAVFGAAAMSMTAITLAVAPAQASSSYSPVNVWNTSHCLDNATENNSKVQIWRCTGGREQNWSISLDPSGDWFTFKNQNTQWCLAAPALGTPTAFMEPCDPNSVNQRWDIDFADNPLGPPSGTYDLWQSELTGFCLSLNSIGDGNSLYMNNCDPSDQYDRWHQQ
jgi:hypothetical protein